VLDRYGYLVCLPGSWPLQDSTASGSPLRDHTAPSPRPSARCLRPPLERGYGADGADFTSGSAARSHLSRTRPGPAFRPHADHPITDQPVRRNSTGCKTALNFLSFGAYARLTACCRWTITVGSPGSLRSRKSITASVAAVYALNGTALDYIP